MQRAYDQCYYLFPATVIADYSGDGAITSLGYFNLFLFCAVSPRSAASLRLLAIELESFCLFLGLLGAQIFAVMTNLLRVHVPPSHKGKLHKHHEYVGKDLVGPAEGPSSARPHWRVCFLPDQQYLQYEIENDHQNYAKGEAWYEHSHSTWVQLPSGPSRWILPLECFKSLLKFWNGMCVSLASSKCYLQEKDAQQCICIEHKKWPRVPCPCRFCQICGLL